MWRYMKPCGGNIQVGLFALRPPPLNLKKGRRALERTNQVTVQYLLLFRTFHQSSWTNPSVWVWKRPRTELCWGRLRVSAQVLHEAPGGPADDASTSCTSSKKTLSLLRFTFWEPPDRRCNSWMLLPCSVQRVKSLLHCVFVFLTHSAACQMTPDPHLPSEKPAAKQEVHVMKPSD